MKLYGSAVQEHWLLFSRTHVQFLVAYKDAHELTLASPGIRLACGACKYMQAKPIDTKLNLKKIQLSFTSLKDI